MPIGLFVFLIALALWIGFSIRRVKPTEMAVKVIFEKPVGCLSSGFCFIPRFPGCYPIKVSTKQYKVDVPAVEAYSKSGEYSDGIFYGSEPLEVDATLYLYFPKPGEKDEEGNERLIKVIRAKIPTTEEGLVDHFTNPIQGIIRTAIGKVVWRIAVEKVEKIRKMSDEAFRSPESILKSAGFSDEDFSLAIERVELPPKLKAVLSRPDEERLKALAAKSVAKKDATELVGVVMEAFAQTKGKTLEEIQKEIEGDEDLARDFLAYAKDINLRIKEADRGALTDIRVPEGVQGIEKTILEAFALLKSLLSNKSPSGKSGEGSKKKTRKVKIGGEMREVEVGIGD